MSEVKVNKISPRSGTTVTLGDSGDTIAINSGASLTGFTSTGIDDNATSTAITIDSSENVGIGTGSPSSKLHIVGSTSAERTLIIEDTFGNDVQIQASVSSGNASMIFKTEDTEHMRIDSSGNVLIGKTTANNTDTGTTIYGSAPGNMSLVRDSGTCMVMNRLNTDGDIVAFRKDGTTVGTIGSRGGASTFFEMTSSGTGVSGSDAGSGAILPYSSGNISDNVLDIGASSYRWNDLYLGGSVYLGGTGSTNALDDYEEGTWTPQLRFGGSGTGITFDAALNVGTYIKIGKFVHLFFDLRLTSKGTATGSASLRNIPFVTGSISERGIVTIGYYASMTTVSGITGRGDVGATSATLSKNRDESTGAIIDLTDTNFTNTSRLMGTFIYQIA